MITSIRVDAFPSSTVVGYFAERIYRSEEVKQQFEEDLNTWHDVIKEWCSNINVKVGEWNKQVEELFNKEEAVIVKMAPIQLHVFSVESLIHIFESPINPSIQKKLYCDVVHQFSCHYSSIVAHFEQLHKICNRLLLKSTKNPGLENVLCYSRKFKKIFSPQHLVSSSKDPEEALHHLQNIPIEFLNNEEGHPDFDLLEQVHALIFEQLQQLE